MWLWILGGLVLAAIVAEWRSEKSVDRRHMNSPERLANKVWGTMRHAVNTASMLVRSDWAKVDKSPATSRRRNVKILRDRRGEWGLPIWNTPDDVQKGLGLATFSELVHLAAPSRPHQLHLITRVTRSLKGEPVATKDETELAAIRASNYHTLEIPKRRGGTRLLHVPKKRLKEVQRHLLKNLIGKIPVHAATRAFRRGHDPTQHARDHVGKRILASFDLKDFFPSIHRRRIRMMFIHCGYPQSVARILSLLVTTLGPDPNNPGRRVLPQGAPTSPALANIVCWRLDRRLTGLAKKFDATYSRYADDLTFSGGEKLLRGMKHFLPRLKKIVAEERFRTNPKKKRIMRAGNRQMVTGLVVNKRASVPRDERDQLKAIIHNAAKAGSLESQNRDKMPNFAEHLRGRVEWMARFHPQQAAKLRDRLKLIPA